MSETDDSGIINTCNFCGATNQDEMTTCLIQGDDGSIICNMCVAQAEAIVTGEKREDITLYDVMEDIRKSAMATNLSPITKIPKSWLVCKANLFNTNPSVTACSPDGIKFRTFAIPKPLAHWMISSDERIDIDKIREEIKQDLIEGIKREFRLY